MLNNIVVRRLLPNDLNDFFYLRLESLKEFSTNFLSSFEEEKKSGSNTFENLLLSDDVKNVIFGAFTKDKLIGIFGIYQDKATKASHKCNIWGMYVQSDYRGHGIGKSLLDAAINHAKEHMKVLMINLTVESTNVAAKSLYESFGFKSWGLEIKAICVDNRFYDEFHMSLFL